MVPYQLHLVQLAAYLLLEVYYFRVISLVSFTHTHSSIFLSHELTQRFLSSSPLSTGLCVEQKSFFCPVSLFCKACYRLQNEKYFFVFYFVDNKAYLRFIDFVDLRKRKGRALLTKSKRTLVIPVSTSQFSLNAHISFFSLDKTEKNGDTNYHLFLLTIFFGSEKN